MDDRTTTIPSDRQQALAAAVEGLYTAFARYKLHHPVTGCPCCTSAEDDRRVQSKPLHQLGSAHLERYAFKAVSTLGTVNDLKHFLPRLLELAAAEGTVGYADIEVVLGKLAYTDWAGWPEGERAAVRQYLVALWRHVLGAYPCTPDADATLCAIGRAEDDLGPYLDAWATDESPAADRHLAEFVDRHAHDLLKKRRLGNAFWGGRAAQMRQVMDWLLAPATVTKLEQAFFRCDDPAVAAEVSQAVDRLDWSRRRRGDR